MVGSTISHYRIVEKLGSGGMGVVYKAEDLNLRRTVALKTLQADSPELRARLLNEAEAAAALNHPNICTIYEIDRENLLLAMEYVEGRTVAERVRERPLPLPEAIDIAIQAGQALTAAHHKGVVHRDIKSANVMVVQDGTVKIMDFGLALTLDATRITQTGTALGTPAYMAPEQAASGPVDHRADIWALAVLLYEMIAGTLPFRGDTTAAVLYAVLHHQPEPLTSLRTGVPIELDRIVGKALAKDPAGRYQHIDDMVVDLRLVRDSLSSSSRTAAPSPHPHRRLRRSVLLIAAASLLLLAAVLGYLRRPAPSPTGRPGIAVLPLEDLSAAARSDYFSDGMTDALITELGTIGSLRVISRTSVMRYKGRSEPLSKVAADLNVNHVLEGSVLQDHDRIRLSARLIRVQGEEQIWARTWERDLTNVLSLQRDLARSVATEVGVRFRSAQTAAPATVQPQAYRAYLLGRQYFDGQRLPEAMDQFERAIDLDPSFASACAALSRCYANGGRGRLFDRLQLRDKAVELARKALELDPANTDAYVSLGWVKTYFEYDWPGAARAFQRALELNPSSSEAVHSYSHYLVIAGDIQAALDASRQAAELSPFDRRISAHQIWALYMARRFPEAAATAQSVLQTDPGSSNARTYALMVYDQLPDHRRLVEEASRLKNEAYLARGLALSGDHAGARQMLARLAANSHNEEIRIALIYLALGDKPTALTWLERSFERRLYPLPDITADARFDPLRSEPRFQEILRRLGLGSRAPL